MEPSEYLAVLRRRWLTLLITTLLGLGASVLLMVATPPVYRTSAKVFLSTTEGKSVSELVQGSNYAQNLVQSYADLATTPVVLDPVITELNLSTTPEALAGDVRADVTLNTVIIEISASASNGATAAAIANTVGKQLAVAVQNVSPKGLKSGEAIQISPISPAKVPSAPSWPNRKLLGALGLALGLALGIGLSLLRDVWGSRIRNEEGLARATSAPLLGTVPANRKDGVQALGAHGVKADAFRRLEQSLSFYVTRGNTFSFATLTPRATVGATLTAVNLAVTLAEAGRRVVLVDGDLRRPSIAEHMGLRYQRGLSRLIADQAPVDDALKDWDDGAVRVLPGGPGAGGGRAEGLGRRRRPCAARRPGPAEPGRAARGPRDGRRPRPAARTRGRRARPRPGGLRTRAGVAGGGLRARRRAADQEARGGGARRERRARRRARARHGPGQGVRAAQPA